MKLDKIAILDALSALNVPYESRSKILSLALARVIGYGLPLPSAKSDLDDFAFFTQERRTVAENLVCAVNEHVAVNIDETLSVVGAIWTFRYRLLFQQNNSTMVNFLDAILRAGVSNVSPQFSELLTTYSDDKALVNALCNSVWNTTIFETEPVADAPVVDESVAPEVAPVLDAPVEAPAVVDEAAPVAAVDDTVPAAVVEEPAAVVEANEVVAVAADVVDAADPADAAVSVENASCTCPSMECAAHTYSAEGFKSFFKYLTDGEHRAESSVKFWTGVVENAEKDVDKIKQQLAVAKKEERPMTVKDLQETLDEYQEGLADWKAILRNAKDHLERVQAAKKKKEVLNMVSKNKDKNKEKSGDE